MNLKRLDDRQRQDLTDLLVMGMYADAHLAEPESCRINRLLDEMGLASPHARQLFVHASILRVRRNGLDVAARSNAIAGIADRLPEPAARREVCGALAELLASDGDTARAETDFLRDVRQAFRC